MTFSPQRLRWRYVRAEGGRVVGVGAGQGWRYQSTNGLDSPALYVSITTPTLCFPFGIFKLKNNHLKEQITTSGQARKWYQRATNRRDSGELYVSITTVTGQ